MPTGKDHIVYWDTCIFFAWMKNEKRQPGHMEGLRRIADLVERAQLVLITSTITRAEIYQSKTSPEAMKKYDNLLRRSNVVAQNVDLPIAKLTSELMEFYIDSDFELLTPDAIHLATAIHFNAHEFHTYDGLDPRAPRRTKYKRCGLLLLDGNVAGHPLKIHVPSEDQYELTLKPIPDEGSLVLTPPDEPLAHQEALPLTAGEDAIALVPELESGRPIIKFEDPDKS